MTRIHCLDLDFQGRARAIAAYLVMAPEGPILVETGPVSTLPTLLKRMAERGVVPADLRGIFVTHIHLDHAGAAGHLAHPKAPVYVHPAGAPHLVDPSRLLASAGRVYGEDMDRLWGRMRALPDALVIPVADGEVIERAGLAFEAIETPGHARHHHAWRLGDRAFTGDAAGVRLPGQKLVALPAPPPEFDLEAWERTIARLEGLQLAEILPTHFGPHRDVAWQLQRFALILREAAGMIKEGMDEGLERDALLARYRDWDRAQAEAAGLCEADLAAYAKANPLAMSVDGIARYWRKRSEREAG
jgi:glyoxylase-like metal-dependent hydrolase (beta-lactamase superfamily II)